MKCPHCGRIIAENSKFCEFCGKPVQQTPGNPAPQPKKRLKSCLSTILILAGIMVGAYALWMFIENRPIPDPFDKTSVVERPGYESVLSERHLTEADLVGKTAWELKVMRNSIYAIHGYRFKAGRLYDNFAQYSWYQPDTDDAAAVYYRMTEIEQYNVSFIKKYEKAHK